MCPCLLVHGGDHAELTANPENPASVNSRMAPSTHSHTVTKLVNDDVLISFDNATQLPKPEDSSLAQLSCTLRLAGCVPRTTSVPTAMGSRLGAFRHYCKHIHM